MFLPARYNPAKVCFTSYYPSSAIGCFGSFNKASIEDFFVMRIKMEVLQPSLDGYHNIWLL